MLLIVSFRNIGQRELREWDESRNGVNAYEMSFNHDYINNYYDGKPDTWNAKPPLLTWLIVISYKIFGFNEFAIRFPTAISGILFFVFAYKLIILFESELFAFVVCLILLSCKAILGDHIGLTGDYDMLLTFLLTAATYYFILFVEFNKQASILFCSICLGLAFYTKGPEAFILFPGFLIYLLVRRKLIDFFKSPYTWIASGLFVGIMISWFVLLNKYQVNTTNSYYGTKSNLEVMLFHDTIRRMTSTEFDVNHYKPNHLFFFNTIDVRLNLWNYIFYLSILTAVYYIFITKRSLKDLLSDNSNRLVMLSCAFILPLSLILTFAENKHDWYMAPVFLFFICIIVKEIFYLRDRWFPFNVIWMGLLAFTIVRHFNYMNDLNSETHYVLTDESFLNMKQKIVFSPDIPKQNILLYFELAGKHIQVVPIENLLQLSNEDLVLFDKNRILEFQNIKPVLRFDDYCLGVPAK